MFDVDILTDGLFRYLPAFAKAACLGLGVVVTLFLFWHLRGLMRIRAKAFADLAEAEQLLQDAAGNLPRAEQALIRARRLLKRNPEAYHELCRELEFYQKNVVEHGTCWPPLRDGLGKMRTYLEGLSVYGTPAEVARRDLDDLLETAHQIAGFEIDIRYEDVKATFWRA